MNNSIDHKFINACVDAALAYQLSSSTNPYSFYRNWFHGMAKKGTDPDLKKWLAYAFEFKKKGAFANLFKRAISRLEQGANRYSQAKALNDAERLLIAFDYFKQCNAIVVDIGGEKVDISAAQEKPVARGIPVIIENA